MSANLATILVDSASRRGDATALKLDDAELSYAMLDGASAHVAGLLRERGVEPGDRVGIMLRTSRTSPSATTACCAPAPSSCR